MAPSPYRTFAPLDQLPADWPNAIAEFLASGGLNLGLANTTTVSAPVNSQPRLSLSVNGLWRYTDTEVDVAVGSHSAGTYDIVAATTANVFVPPGGPDEGETDSTDYSFTLHIQATGTLPTGGGITAAQKVGEIDWDGSKVVGFRQLVGALRATDPLSPTSPAAAVVALRVIGASGQTGKILTVEQGGTVVASVDPAGNVTAAGGFTADGIAVPVSPGAPATISSGAISNVVRRPNLTRPVFVNALVALDLNASSSPQTAGVVAQCSASSSPEPTDQVAEASVQVFGGAAQTETQEFVQTLSFWVPPGYYYKLVPGGAGVGVASVINAKEWTL